ncbi:3-hydroxyacyl-CoA dehydrogenase [Paracoccus sp. YIM 132242]|uniref:3-hydroxyacyl-CoA dehydrogenase n=1 Tax=Paracoccus lichenicola TaxID=2665644 RepID=A0A6L6HPM5_9RHOB|nr:3-hydroxyacyl-CoA dehydrogenase/enoyl-CoA hydratase family protein [Paracoccus lichenicola]MTE00281.1 3-hydroxyacyl-CoA dehydrogenase [Paracoccus lichenicola]
MNKPFGDAAPVALGAAETGVRRAAVIGAGSMGSGIAAQFANAGIPVDLLDMPGGDTRIALAEGGIARQLKAGGFMVPEAAALVRPGNVEDHLDRLAEADWIVEAVIEDLGIKRDLYRRIDAVRRPGSIVSSNTSTILRGDLVEGLGKAFARDFIVTHFFNPPRVMRLVEIVPAPETPAALLARADAANRAILGKTVVICRDTPGFIANRIGCYWMAVAALEAAHLGLTVEQADAVNAAFDIPRTGVFGLFDLIGIDLVPHVWGSLHATLPAGDGLQAFNLSGDALFRAMVAEGRHGRKTGQGFYRKSPKGTREALDLATGQYRAEAAAGALPGHGRDLAALLADDGPLGRYAFSVLSHVVAYAAQNGPDIADDVETIDTAVVLGYSWREGPFRLADRAGVAALAARMTAEGREIPRLLAAAAAQGGFYRDGQPLRTDGQGRAPIAAPGILGGAAQIGGNGAARLRDIGEDVACLELATKMNTFAPEVFEVLDKTLARAGHDFRALVLGNEDPRAFSAGADLGFILRMIDEGGTAALDRYLQRGQDLFLQLKYAPVPVVAAAHGFALGGGCEFMLHADAVVAHAELSAGLPEIRVGLIPGWGGCTQLTLRGQAAGAVPAALHAFDVIRTGAPATSAAQAFGLGLLRAGDDIVMHRDALLPAAKVRALAMASGYVAPAPATLTPAGAEGRAAIADRIAEERAAGRMTETDAAIGGLLAQVLTGGDHTDPITETQMMALEREAFLHLVVQPTTRARMNHMLETGKPLRN